MSGNSLRFRGENGSRIAALVLLASIFLAGNLPAQTCTPGVDQVSVDYIPDPNNNNNPKLEGDSKVRREHVHISTELRDALGIVLGTDDDVKPQIRVVVDTPLLLTNDVSAANFTVVETYDDGTNESLRFHAENDGDPTEVDEDSGYFKLFEERTGVVLSTVQVTVHPLAPSRSAVTDLSTTPPSTTTTDHFCEPNASYEFEEAAEVAADDRFVLLVPHGGEIEEGTSEQVPTIRSTLATHGIDTNLWEAQGNWHDEDIASEHWHITSTALNGPSFPALNEHLTKTPWDDTPSTPVLFQYAVSLHGFGKYQGDGLVLGGRAHREAKCLVARKIQEGLEAAGRPPVAFYIWDLDDVSGGVLDIPDHTGRFITDDRPSVGLSGKDSDNIVNRMSYNEDGLGTGHGGIQVEESFVLRQDAALTDLIAQQIGHAVADLVLNDPVDANDPTAICDSLYGEIEGRVWNDSDGDGVQDAGEAGVPGVTVELYRNGEAGPGPAATAVTDALGEYRFEDLYEHLQYQVRVPVPAGYELSPSTAGDPDASSTDSDVDATTGLSAELALHGDEVRTVDAGLEPVVLSRIGDLVWIDRDESGTQDPGEPGLAGVTVDLFTSAGALVASTVSGAGGGYLFEDLNDGDYYLRFTAPAGYDVTGKGQGGSPELDSDVDDVTGETALIELGASEIDLSWDAGYTVDCFDSALVAFASEWKTRSAFEAGWNEPGFDDSLSPWDELQATLGYPADDVHKEVDEATTVYFRLEFEVGDPSLFDSLDLTVFRDDGAVVYLNGAEVLRSNMPAGPIDSGTFALGSSNATETVNLPASLLVPNTNVLAVEVHERGSTDDDLAFDLELRSTVCRPCVQEASFTLDRGTYVRGNRETNNYGDELAIEMDSSPEKNGLFAWPISGLPSGAGVLHAEIVVSVSNSSSDTFVLYPLLKDWDEDEATWLLASTGPNVPWASPGGAEGSGDHGDPVGLIHFTSTTPNGLIELNVSGREAVEGWISGAPPASMNSA